MTDKPKSTVHTVEGIAMYPRLYENNRDMHEGFYGDCEGAYTVDVILDKENLDALSASGSRLKPRITDEGLSIKFKRKHKHPSIPALGGAPVIKDAEGELWDNSKLIGNGSKVKVAFEVYETKMGKGTRMMGVQVLDLVEYERPEGDDEGGSADLRLPF